MHKNYYTITSASFLVTFLVCCWINYYIDPAHLFDNKNTFETEIAKKLHSGINVSNISNYDERILQNKYIELLNVAPDISVLGSSRSLMIRKDQFSGFTFFNNSVSGASLEDQMAIYQMYHQKDLLPKKIILGIDPWDLNKNNDQHRWESISSFFYKITDRLKINTEKTQDNKKSSKYLQLVSFSYLKESFKVIIKKIKRMNTEIIETDKTHLASNTKLADGSFVYAKHIRDRSIKDVQTMAIGSANRGNLYALNYFTELDDNLKNMLEKFLDSAISDNVEPVIYLPPYHPLTYAAIKTNKKYKTILKAERYIRDIANDFGIKTLGSYDPALAGCDESQFTDDMHPKDTCINIIFSDFN